MIKYHSQVNKTLPKIICEKVIDVWLSSYVKLASKSVPKSIKNEPWLPYWSSVGPNWLPESPPNYDPLDLLSTYLRSTWIGSISLTPFWSIFEGIYFQIRFGLDFVSILGSEMGPKCNKIDSKSILFLLRCCDWFFGVSS